MGRSCSLIKILASHAFRRAITHGPERNATVDYQKFLTRHAPDNTMQLWFHYKSKTDTVDVPTWGLEQREVLSITQVCLWTGPQELSPEGYAAVAKDAEVKDAYREDRIHYEKVTTGMQDQEGGILPGEGDCVSPKETQSINHDCKNAWIHSRNRDTSRRDEGWDTSKQKEKENINITRWTSI